MPNIQARYGGISTFQIPSQVSPLKIPSQILRGIPKVNGVRRVVNQTQYQAKLYAKNPGHEYIS